MQKILLFIIKVYQRYISPFWSNTTCRYYPSCSEYTKQAIEKYGVRSGSFRGIKRIISCNPWSSRPHIDLP